MIPRPMLVGLFSPSAVPSDIVLSHRRRYRVAASFDLHGAISCLGRLKTETRHKLCLEETHAIGLSKRLTENMPQYGVGFTFLNSFCKRRSVT